VLPAKMLIFYLICH